MNIRTIHLNEMFNQINLRVLHIKLNSVPNLVGGVQLNQGGLKNGK
jgi:hypothetical protein